jgi:hypothetical protein
MGLGKTIRTLVFLENTKRVMASNPLFLVVAPLSVVETSAVLRRLGLVGLANGRGHQ